jgi:hypothetical protein
MHGFLSMPSGVVRGNPTRCSPRLPNSRLAGTQFDIETGFFLVKFPQPFIKEPAFRFLSGQSQSPFVRFAGLERSPLRLYALPDPWARSRYVPADRIQK